MTTEQCKEWLEHCPPCGPIAPGLVGWRMNYEGRTTFCSECVGRIVARGIGTQAMRNAEPIWRDKLTDVFECAACGKQNRLPMTVEPMAMNDYYD